MIVDHDGLHGESEKPGFVALEAGQHPIRVRYFERGGDEALTVLYRGPGIPKQSVPAAVLFHRDP